MSDLHLNIELEPELNFNVSLNAVGVGSTPLSFLGLTDVDPVTYLGQALKIVRVNAAENGLEFGASAYVLPVATAAVLGGVKEGSGVTIAADGTISAAGTYTLPIATAAALGGIKVGSRLTIDPVTGVLSADIQGPSMVYPGVGIAVSTGAAWGSSITDNSTNWNTAFAWGNHAGLYLPSAGAGDIYTHNASEFLTSVTAHNLLSTVHGDTLADTVVRGDILIGNSTPKWSRLAFPASPAGKVLVATATDIEWSTSALGTAAYTASTAYEVPLTFSSGLTRTVNAVTNDLITGKAGGQSIYGDTASGGNLILSSTFHGTKGKIQIGTSYYDEVNNRLGLGVTTPLATLDFKAGSASANTAPIRLASGPVETTARVGLIEFLTDDLYFTITTGAARKRIAMTDGAALTSGRIPTASTNGRLIDSADLSGSGTRSLNITAAGALSAGSSIVAGKLADGATITLLTTGTNWTLGLYTGSAISGTYEGMYYKDDNYYYTAYADNDWIRIPRA